MAVNKSDFLAGLATNLEADTEGTSPTVARRGRVSKLVILGAMLAATASMFVVSPSPAMAVQNCSDFYKPNFVPKTHWKYCGVGSYEYVYESTTYINNARTECYNFHGYAWVCSTSSQYDRGQSQACKTF